VLNELGAAWELELGDSSEHDDIGSDFRAYLLERLDEVLENAGIGSGPNQLVSKRRRGR
jgi:hypothetical protein